MTDRQLIAQLRITPSGLFECNIPTIMLEQVDGAYEIAVIEQDGITSEETQRSISVATELVDQQLAVLKTLTVPAFPVSPVVCDGQHVELLINGECSSLTLGWWTQAPEGGEGVSEFADWLYEVAYGREEDESFDEDD